MPRNLLVSAVQSPQVVALSQTLKRLPGWQTIVVPTYCIILSQFIYPTWLWLCALLQSSTGHNDPTELFYELIKEQKFEEALQLAERHPHLDVDSVRKQQWLRRGATVLSIETMLSCITDKLWVIQECVRTVPISYEACKALIDLGLKEANRRLLYSLGDDSPNKSKSADLPADIEDDNIDGFIDYAHLNVMQKLLCRYRQDLICLKHCLAAYENALADTLQDFEHEFYYELRQISPFEASIIYAHNGSVEGVETMLNYYTDELKGHYLPIVTNFPETLSPSKYSNLLPSRDGKWRSYGNSEVIEDDWSDIYSDSNVLKSKLKDAGQEYALKFYQEQEHLRKFQNVSSPQLVIDWYTERAFEMESRTLLLTNPIKLLRLAKELDIDELQTNLDDLEEFDEILYENLADNEDNIYLSMTEFNRKPLLDRVLLMTGNSIKNCKKNFRFHVIPYLSRRDSQLGFEGKSKLLRDFFNRLAHTRDHLCQPILNDLLDKIESDTFVANWTKDLDDVIDEIQDEVKNIANTREAQQLSDVAIKNLNLDDLNACYEACSVIMKKNFNQCWQLCCQLGLRKDFNNNEAKYKLLAFALAHCDQDTDGRTKAKILNSVIELRKRDEKIQLAYLQLNM